MACECGNDFNNNNFMNKTLNYAFSIAVKISGQNNKFVLHMMINKGQLISTKILQSQNYTHVLAKFCL